jgi:PAT family acetyl-CoA transporter-like MFS transporter 1
MPFCIFTAFIYTWGIFILIITLLIGVFKKEKNVKLEENYVKLNVVQNYKLLWKILKLSRVRILAVALITMRVNITMQAKNKINL